jgi:hypothetical protein
MVGGWINILIDAWVDEHTGQQMDYRLIDHHMHWWRDSTSDNDLSTYFPVNSCSMPANVIGPKITLKTETKISDKEITTT